jgi:hypothetical protein
MSTLGQTDSTHLNRLIGRTADGGKHDLQERTLAAVGASVSVGAVVFA